MSSEEDLNQTSSSSSRPPVEDCDDISDSPSLSCEPLLSRQDRASRIVSMRWWEELVIDQDRQVKSRERLSEPSERPACRSGTTSKADPLAVPDVKGCHLPTLSFDHDATNDLAIELVEVDGDGDVLHKKSDRGHSTRNLGRCCSTRGISRSLACLHSTTRFATRHTEPAGFFVLR